MPRIKSLNISPNLDMITPENSSILVRMEWDSLEISTITLNPSWALLFSDNLLSSRTQVLEYLKKCSPVSKEVKNE